MIGEPVAFMFVLPEVGDVAGDVIFFQSFQRLAAAVARVGYDLFYLNTFPFQGFF